MKPVRKVKRIVLTVGLIIVLIGGFSILTMAAVSNTVSTIAAVIDTGIRIELNGERFIYVDPVSQKELTPILYKGRSYLPVRAVSEAVGLPVNWNERNKTIYLGEQLEDKQGNTSVPPYTINSVKAFLHYTHDGTFSENIIDNHDFTLWNVIIGEGSAKGPSDSTRVDVEILGDHNGQDMFRMVQLIATNEEGSTILNRANDIYIAQNGRFVTSFWLYNTGTEKVYLTARILGQGSNYAEVKKSIEFAFGE